MKKKLMVNKMRDVETGKIYRHFKSYEKLYKVEDVGFDCETLKEKVIYRALYGDNKLWVRDKDDFLSEVGERSDNVTNQTYRFEVYDK